MICMNIKYNVIRKDLLLIHLGIVYQKKKLLSIIFTIFLRNYRKTLSVQYIHPRQMS
jgi:hypothetical protein